MLNEIKLNLNSSEARYKIKGIKIVLKLWKIKALNIIAVMPLVLELKAMFIKIKL
jgi:hypothetical protein